MKASMNKPVVFIIVAAIALLIAAATTLAGEQPGEHQWKHGIEGVYAVVGSATCVVAPLGFTNLVPNPPPSSGVWLNYTGYLEGVYTFHRSGVGSFKSLWHHSFQPGPAIPISPYAGSQSQEFEFTYTVTNGGVITFKPIPCSVKACTITPTACVAPDYSDNIPRNGVISPNGEKLIINCGVPEIMNTGTCSGKTFTPSGTQLACNISLSGFRIPSPIPMPSMP